MSTLELSEQEQIRRNSLAELRKLGINPYPAARFDVTATAREILDGYDESKGNFADVRIADNVHTIDAKETPEIIAENAWQAVQNIL